MKVVEAGDICHAIAKDAVGAVNAAVSDAGGWMDVMDIEDVVTAAIRKFVAERIPTRGFVVEATKDEIRGLRFNVFSVPVTLAKKESEVQA